LDRQSLSYTLDKIIPIFTYIFFAFSVISIAGTQISLGFVFVLSILKVLLNRKWYFHHTSLDWAFLFFILAYFLSTFFSSDIAQSLKHFKNLLLILALYLVAFNLRTVKQIRIAADTLVITATVMAFFGILMTDIGDGKRVMGLQSTTMTWGALSAIFTLITASLFLFGVKNKKRWFYLGAFIIQLISMIFSYVRGSWIGFIAGIIVLSLLKSKKIFFAGLILVVLVFLLAPPMIQHRILSITDLSVGSTQVRFTQWRNAIEIFKDHPITGVGWIDLLEVHREYAPPGADLSYQAYQIGHFHNNYVMFLVCFGVMGLIAGLFLVFQLFRTNVRILKSIPKDDYFLSALSLGVIAMLTAFWVNGLFDWTFGDAEPVTLLWAVVGLGIAAGQVMKSKELK